MFLKNTWYVAAWSRDVGDSLLPRTVLNEKIVLYRTTNKTIVALEDACPHRKLPLSKGRKLGDIIECGYHGLQFDCFGVCVLAPTQNFLQHPHKVSKLRPNTLGDSPCSTGTFLASVPCDHCHLLDGDRAQ